MNVVLLISGKQGSGKTTLAKQLWNTLVKDPDIAAAYLWKFADPLYEMESAIAQIMARMGRPIQSPDKRLLQLLGTEWGRACLGQNVWSDVACARVARIMAAQQLTLEPVRRVFIFDDARFVNEVEAFDALKSVNPQLRILKMRLEAPEHVRRVRTDVWRSQTDHPSETSLDQYHRFDKIVFTDTNDAEAVHFVTHRFVRAALNP